MNQLTGEDAETPFVKRLKAQETQKVKMRVKPSGEVTTDLDRIAQEVKHLNLPLRDASSDFWVPSLPIVKPEAPKKRVKLYTSYHTHFTLRKDGAKNVNQFLAMSLLIKRQKPTKSRKRVAQTLTYPCLHTLRK